MNQFRSLTRKYPLLYSVGIFLLIIGLLWVVYRLAQISWVITSILVGILITLGFDLPKHVRPTFWSFAANITAALVAFWVYVALEQSWWAKCLILVAFTPLFIFANWTTKRDMQLDARRRNEQADQLVQQVLAGEAGQVPAFALYLRPFFTTDRLPGQTLPSDLTPMDQKSDHVDLETLFKRALDKEFELIALSRFQDILEGAARVSVQDQGWRETVQKLLDQAALIIVVPFAREGTLWEIQQLKAGGYLEKTLFLMPEMQMEQPNGVVVPLEQEQPWDAGITRYSPSEHYIDFPSEWRKVRQSLNQEGLALPPYSRGGAMFTLDPATGCTKRITPLILSLLFEKGEYIQTVLAEFSLLPGRPGAGTDLLDALEWSTFQSKKNREFVLTLALELFATLGDSATASVILQRIHTIVGEGTPLIDQALENLGAMISDAERQKGIDWDLMEEERSYLHHLQNVEGIDKTRVDLALWQVEEALHRRGKLSL